MLRLILQWLLVFVKVRAAMVLPPTAENGLWITHSDEDGKFDNPIRIDFIFQSDDTALNPQVKRRDSTDKPAWLLRGEDSSDKESVRPALESKPAWPWRRAESPLLQRGIGEDEDEDFGQLLSRDSAADASPAAKDSGCGKNILNQNDAEHAAEQIASYCEQVGVVSAYQHIAYKWESAVAYICARGHTETCRPPDFIGAISYLEEVCHSESGWVYNNYLVPRGPANKYGVDVVGANFC